MESVSSSTPTAGLEHSPEEKHGFRMKKSVVDISGLLCFLISSSKPIHFLTGDHRHDKF